MGKPREQEIAMQSAAPDTIDFAEAFAALAREAAPQGTGESAVQMAGQSIRLLAFAGVGGWHRHDAAEETVIVWSGVFDVECRDRTVRLGAGQCTVIGRGQEHRGVSAGGAQVVLVRAA